MYCINPSDILEEYSINNKKCKYYSLSKLEKCGYKISHLPYSLRILLESTFRNFDGDKINEKHINTLLNWRPNDSHSVEIPFLPTRIILQDYTAVPLLVDLAAMREHIVRLNLDPNLIDSNIPVDVIIDHSLQTDYTSVHNAAELNMKLEISRNLERFKFLKWASKSFKNIKILPPGLGIVHQINLEFLAKGIFNKNNIFYPDSVIGSDSHTTMINGLGILGWGVGGIEAESVMLGNPLYISIPEIIGVNLSGNRREGVTATDIVLTISQILRKENVVGKIIEYFGDGVSYLSIPDRATIANMAPEYGATMGLFYVDDQTINYYRLTNRPKELLDQIENYYKNQNLFNLNHEKITYSKIININLNEIQPCISGPHRPQDRIDLSNVKETFANLLFQKKENGGFNKTHLIKNSIVNDGDIIVAAITSCTNTSNPNLLVTAGLLAKKAVTKGLKLNQNIMASITPGSRAVSAYLKKLGLQEYLDKLGFYNAGYGCAACVGNIGKIDEDILDNINSNNIIACAILSGNRNFEARIHPKLRANFLMSPPLVIAYAIAGNILKDVYNEPLGYDNFDNAIFLKDIWPSEEEVSLLSMSANNVNIYKETYSENFIYLNPLWNEIQAPNQSTYQWENNSTYIAEPPFFHTVESNTCLPDIYSAKVLMVLGDSVTTDHISPAGPIPKNSIAGIFLREKNVSETELNSYGSRRGNHEIMLRGAFSNERLKNKLIDEEGSLTIHYPSSEVMSIYDAAIKYGKEKTPLIIIAGKEYGIGSSRDWAAKCTKLLGIKAIIAESFERIHKSNLIGMGILPCSLIYPSKINLTDLKNDMTFDIIHIEDSIEQKKPATLVVHKKNGITEYLPLLIHINNESEINYVKNGGILPTTLKNIISLSMEYSC